MAWIVLPNYCSIRCLSEEDILMKFLHFCAMAVVGSLLATTTPAAAGLLTIDSSNWGPCLGLASCNIGSATVSAQPAGATLDQQNFASTTGLGIDFLHTGAAADPEIQYPEVMNIAFGGTGTITTLQLNFLYNTSHFSNDPQEIAIITSDPNGVSTTYTLMVLSDAPNDWTWTGQGTVTRDSLDQGLWT